MLQCVSHYEKEWMFDGEELPPYAMVSSSGNKMNLLIMEVTLLDSGEYTCTARSESGFVYFAQSYLEVLR